MGERSWQESVQELQVTLQNLTTVLSEGSLAGPVKAQVAAELTNVARRIQLLGYAAQKSRDQRHTQWHEEVRHQVRGHGHGEGIDYTPDQLRGRARVS